MGWAELPEYKTCNQTKDELYRNIVKRIDITCHTGNQSGNESRDEACNRSEQGGSQNRSDGVEVNRKAQQQCNGTAEDIDNTTECQSREL